MDPDIHTKLARATVDILIGIAVVCLTLGGCCGGIGVWYFTK